MLDEQDLKAHFSNLRFSLKRLSSAYLPFDNGVTSCLERHFVRQEALCTLTILVLKYDIELQIPRNWESKMNNKCFSLKPLPSVEKVLFRIRRRVT